MRKGVSDTFPAPVLHLPDLLVRPSGRREVPMRRKLVPISLLLLLAVLAGVPATAEVFVVTLSNGTTVESGRQPEQSSWDPSTILILTEVGNWIGIQRSQIKTVEP